ncbi:MAG: hypothetical protein LRY68_06465 [Sulfurospirillum sp.]|nr:hypothetical protein [Sulfurospirillum sp.]
MNFLSQIVDYSDAELEKTVGIYKRLNPKSLKTINITPDIDISSIELTHYKLHKQNEMSIKLEGSATLEPISEVGSGVAKDPEKEFLSHIVQKINSLFEGNFTDDDV